MIDKATVVSLCPLAIDERKPGLFPGHFYIAPAKENDFNILVLGPSIYWITDPMGDRPAIKIETKAEEVATSLVNDYLLNIHGRDADSLPGLFFVEGEFTKEVIKTKFASELERARRSQAKWFTNLVKLADDAWTSSGRKHTAISSLQRQACKILGLERDWLVDVNPEIKTTNCPNCNERIYPSTVFCPKCRLVFDEKKFSTMKIAGA